MSNRSMIRVTPVTGGWSVDCPIIDNVLMFTSGAHAERAARTLGASLAAVGYDMCVAIHDRHNELIGTIEYLADQ